MKRKTTYPHWIPEEKGEGWILVVSAIHIRVDAPDVKSHDHPTLAEYLRAHPETPTAPLGQERKSRGGASRRKRREDG